MYNLNWEKTKEGTARLLGVNDMPGELVLPEKIEGLPLTEVGPYCFAKNKYLKRVVLPDTVTKMERMAFYNCTGLESLEMGANLTEIGGDAFMNCHNLHQLIVRCGAVEASGARFVLRQISSDLAVHFQGKTERESAVVLFPDYYESYDEVTPAHLFGRNIEGEGFRARQFFKEGVFEYDRYDGIFSKACAEERETTLCEMAMNRLRYPVELSERAKAQYAEYVLSHVKSICRKAVEHRDRDVLEFLCKNKLMEQNDADYCVLMAAEKEWIEGGAYILQLKARYFTESSKDKRYEFDDF